MFGPPQLPPQPFADRKMRMAFLAEVVRLRLPRWNVADPEHVPRRCEMLPLALDTLT
jgi:hypothetical protein